jgi:spore germination cell wall hydrolase CwlJ-like protein
LLQTRRDVGAIGREHGEGLSILLLLGRSRIYLEAALFLTALALGGCASEVEPQLAAADLPPADVTPPAEKECLIRAMYFESNRSSDEGLLALGSVVMNRVKSGFYPGTICGVVGQKGQFDVGVLDKPLNPHEKERVEKVAEDVLAGKRHPKIDKAMYFHLAGLHFHYGNMHYVLVAGGNAFYERTGRRDVSQQGASAPPAQSASVPSMQSASAPPVASQCDQTGAPCAVSARLELSAPK